MPERATVSSRSEKSAEAVVVGGKAAKLIVRCAALFSFADHLAAGPATAEAVARVEGLDMDATFRLMRACAAYGADELR
jgi:hypothetical protein